MSWINSEHSFTFHAHFDFGERARSHTVPDLVNKVDKDRPNCFTSQSSYQMPPGSSIYYIITTTHKDVKANVKNYFRKWQRRTKCSLKQGSILKQTDGKVSFTVISFFKHSPYTLITPCINIISFEYPVASSWVIRRFNF